MSRLHFPQRDLAGPARAGETLEEGVRRLGHHLETSCGGGALCGACCVLVFDGHQELTPPDPAEAARLRELGLRPPHRLACRARVTSAAGEITIVAC